MSPSNTSAKDGAEKLARFLNHPPKGQQPIPRLESPQERIAEHYRQHGMFPADIPRQMG